MSKCQTIEAAGKVSQTSLLGNIICGKKSTHTYIGVSRPTDTHAEVCKQHHDFCDHPEIISGDLCPEGKQVCPGNQGVENKICMEDLNECPITDVKIIPRYRLLDGYTGITFGNVQVAFSKKENKRPLTNFKMDF